MNGKVKREIHRIVYGDKGKANKKLFRVSKHKSNRVSGDEKRQTYQKLKKAYTKGRITLQELRNMPVIGLRASNG